MGDASLAHPASLHPPAGHTKAELPDGLVLIDAMCVLCSASFRFVARRDRGRFFTFAPVQSAFGSATARKIGIDPEQPDSFAVVVGGRALQKSDGAIAILRKLPRWRWTAALLLIPRPLRDWLYDRIARNRIRLFGRLDACMIPTPELRAHMRRESL